ncbi:MAG: hypothetical protein CVU65_11140 [Deltaproteobacteria bacterium HGW-Deltaproteobacteria-22]|jgi:hypothetical protein|nr:MAG: hypothetical protein CVU65_11140 [Deltaproteobacteria bacterium HGW-Deltaproteobacteria-22]
MSIPFEIKFDENTYRHHVDGVTMVMHCHHYMSLTVKLADAMEDMGAVKILRESAEDSIRELLEAYFKAHGISSSAERLNIGREMYSVLGLGKMEVFGNDGGGEVKLVRSHVDEGWVQKFGKSSKFVNHFTCGYLAAMFAVSFSRAARTYNVYETASLAMGEPEGKIIVKAN